MAQFIAITNMTDAATLAEKFIENVVRLHGWPKTVVSDRDPRFLGHFWKELLKSFDVKQLLSTDYHPQTDG